MNGLVFHVAAEPEGLTQKCERCGEVIIDFENVMAVVDDARLRFFPAHRLVQHNGTSWIAGAEGVTGPQIRNGLCELPRFAA